MTDTPYLIQSDLQAVYHNKKALEFCVYLKRHYKIPDDHIINIGDELDLTHGGMYPKSPESEHTPNGEIKAAQLWVKEWASYFPKMMVCISNHGLRWARKATAAEIPAQCLRAYQDIFNIPRGWVYKEEWNINTKHPFRAIHGMGYSGQNGHRMAALDSGKSTVIGHLHSHAGIVYLKTQNQDLWAMNSGCMIDSESYAFSYGKYNRFKPCLGTSIVFNDGKLPIWVPLE